MQSVGNKKIVGLLVILYIDLILCKYLNYTLKLYNIEYTCQLSHISAE